MRVIGLISGGKDSCFNLCKAVERGHTPVCLGQLTPTAGYDELNSYMYQTVGHEGVPWIARAMGLPLMQKEIRGHCVIQQLKYYQNDKDEVEDMYALLKEAKDCYGVEAVSVGAIGSVYQKERVTNVCERLNLEVLSLLWFRDPVELLREMIDSGVNAVLVKTSSLGLDPRRHLGKRLDEVYEHFVKLSAKFGFHVCGEGGEYETFVTDCSLFRSKIVVDQSEIRVSEEDPVCSVGYLKLKQLHLEAKAN